MLRSADEDQGIVKEFLRGNEFVGWLAFDQCDVQLIGPRSSSSSFSVRSMAAWTSTPGCEVLKVCTREGNSWAANVRVAANVEGAR